MANCCKQTQFDFVNEATTTIPYGEAMRAQYGTQPRVTVWYFDPVTNEFYQSTFFTVMKFNGSDITIDHGGPNSGFVMVD